MGGKTYNYLTDGTAPASDVLCDGLATSYTPGIGQAVSTPTGGGGGGSQAAVHGGAQPNVGGGGSGGTTLVKSYYFQDLVGSSRVITNAGTVVTDTRLFDAFGGTVASSGTTPTPFGFSGGWNYQTDAGSGLQLLGNRVLTVTPVLLGGDAANDNAVNFDDFLGLFNAFGTSFDPSHFDNGCDQTADFMLDGSVHFDDFLVLLNNFRAAGQP